MIQSYKEIGTRISQQVPEVNWIDLDKGQLEQPEQFNSLIVPAVLIGQSDIDWQQLASRFQQGTGLVTVKTIHVLPAHTHLLDPAFEIASGKMFGLADKIGDAVLCTPGVVTRTNSKDYPSGPYYVIEHTYSVSFRSGPTYTRKRVTFQLHTLLHKPTANA